MKILTNDGKNLLVLNCLKLIAIKKVNAYKTTEKKKTSGVYLHVLANSKPAPSLLHSVSFRPLKFPT